MSFARNIFCHVDGIFKNFTLGSETLQALTHVSFTIEKGEFIVIIGPSGCGKTTLLRLLAGLILPTKGTIVFDRDMTTRTEKRSIGFVPQHPTLMPWRKTIDNIILPLEILGAKRLEMRRKADKLIEFLHLKGCENSYPAELSGGMSQRVSIARALIHDPSILLMDEPFSALDELLRQKLDFELINLKKKMNKTIVFVTHSILEAVILADKIIIMGIYPNTVIAQITIRFTDRTPKLLTEPAFFEKVAEIRKIIDENTRVI